MWCVRERGISALKEPENVERLIRCDAAAKAQKLFRSYANGVKRNTYTSDHMSRGYGSLQRRILEVVADGLVRTTARLAADAYDVKPSEDGITRLSDAQLVTVRRALRSLTKKGSVRYRWHRLGKIWERCDPSEQKPVLSNRQIAQILDCSEATVRRDTAGK